MSPEGGLYITPTVIGLSVLLISIKRDSISGVQKPALSTVVTLRSFLTYRATPVPLHFPLSVFW